MTATSGTHVHVGTPWRPVRLVDLVPVRFTPDGRRSLRLLKSHGAALHAVAAVLTDDQTLGARLAVLAITSGGTDDGDPGVRDLSSAIVVAWLGSRVSSETPAGAAGRAPGPSVLQDVHRLPERQRALLALCKFGGHTFREAALVLGISADQAAALLCDAVRSLAATHPSTGERPVMA